MVIAYKEVENVMLDRSFMIRYSSRRRSGKEFLVREGRIHHLTRLSSCIENPRIS